MDKWVYLSHGLNVNSPSYGNGEGFSIQRVSRIKDGDTSNNSFIHMPSHLGTHIDSPYHFDSNGPTLDLLGPQEFIFSQVHIIDYPAEPEELLGGKEWLNLFESIPEATDLLLVKTGFEKYRKDAELKAHESQYIFHNPGWLPEAGIWLRENRQIKAIGFDFISLTSYQNRILGRQAHRVFLSLKPDDVDGNWNHKPIMIIEDMKLSELEGVPELVVAAPLVFDGADGSPATIFAKYTI